MGPIEKTKLDGMDGADMVQLLQHRTWMLYVHTLLLCVTTCAQAFA
jgi:hypothetical protein